MWSRSVRLCPVASPAKLGVESLAGDGSSRAEGAYGVTGIEERLQRSAWPRAVQELECDDSCPSSTERPNYAMEIR